jgi:hypothetical protein
MFLEFGELLNVFSRIEFDEFTNLMYMYMYVECFSRIRSIVECFSRIRSIVECFSRIRRVNVCFL